MRRFAFLTCLSLLLGSSAVMSQSKGTQYAVLIEEPKPGEAVEVQIAKDMKMKFCWIPPGKAQLGSPKSEQDYVMKMSDDGKRPDWLDRETESARGQFTTKGFWLGKYTVTQEQWKAVMGNNPSYFSKLGSGKDKVAGVDTSRFPVERVSLNDCQDSLERLNDKVAIPDAMGKGKFALPHEDQWEYACRGGKGNKQAFYFGDALSGAQANCDGNSPYGTTTKGPFLGRTTEVGSYEKEAPHPWGLCDMSGNVWQWCENQYDSQNARHTLRGGSWLNLPKGCRSAKRYVFASDNRNNSIGFRIAVVP
jgi:formylglycine-generating enzyme required for sulfatase activity